MLHFRTGTKYPGLEIVIVISDEEYWAAVAAGELSARYPDIQWNASTRVASEEAKVAWIAAMNTYMEAYDDYYNAPLHAEIPLAVHEEDGVRMDKAMEAMVALEIRDPTPTLL